MILLGGGCCPSEVEGTAEGDQSYRYEPVLDTVRAYCEDDRLVVTARTVGWSESAVAGVWDPEALLEPFGFVLPTVGFSRDERCDIMREEYPLEGLTCADVEELSMVVQVNYEEGCAGCAYRGEEPTDDLVDEFDLPTGRTCDGLIPGGCERIEWIDDEPTGCG